MDTKPNGELDQSASGLDFQPYPETGICTRLGDKWTVEVMWRLSIADERKLRFSALMHEVEGITQRMLTLTLRHLERDGLVMRHYHPEVPPRVEYELTEMGAGMLRALKGINTWIRNNMPRIENSRRTYDDGIGK